MKTNKVKQLQFHYDAGHAWLKVSHAELAKQEVANEISFYSYMTKSHAYLEEDCDASKYMNALTAKSISYSIIEVNDGDDSIIRTYATYERPIVSDAIEFTKHLANIMYEGLARDTVAIQDGMAL